MANDNTVFTFWKSNNSNKEFTQSLTDLKKSMNKWLFKKEITFIQQTPNYLLIGLFLADKEGLDCSWQQSDMPQLEKGLKATIGSHYTRIENKA